MSEAENNEQIDADILECKADILRARNVIPPYREKPHEEPKSPKTSENTGEPFNSTKPPVKTGYVKPGIPRFDLAEDIMAEQRKVTAVKRKAPGKKPEAQKHKPEVQPGSFSVELRELCSPQEKQIIAEIVARDIERLCRDY